MTDGLFPFVSVRISDKVDHFAGFEGWILPSDGLTGPNELLVFLPAQKGWINDHTLYMGRSQVEPSGTVSLAKAPSVYQVCLGDDMEVLHRLPQIRVILKIMPSNPLGHPQTRVELNRNRCDHWECAIEGTLPLDGCRNGGPAPLVVRRY